MADARATSLIDLINEVSLLNPEVIASDMSVQAAQADVQTAIWQYYPSPSVSVISGFGSNNSYNKDPVTVLGMEQPLWTGGRLTAGVDSSKASKEVAMASLSEVRESLALRLVQSYVEWNVAKLKEQVIAGSLAVHVDLLKQINRRVNEGLAASSERIQVLSRIQQLESDAQSYRGQSLQAFSTMKHLVARELLEDELLSVLVEPYPVVAELTALSREAFAVSPSLQKARAAIEVAEASHDLSKATLLPRISLSLEHQIDSNSGLQQDSGSRVYISIKSDIGAGLSARSKSASAVALVDSAMRRMDAVQLQLVAQLDSDRLTLQSLQSRKGYLATAINHADAVRESYVRQYLQGRRTWLDVMNAEREVSQLQVQMVEISGGQILSSWRLGILTKGVGGIANLSL